MTFCAPNQLLETRSGMGGTPLDLLRHWPIARTVKSFINDRLLTAANYAVDIDALGSSKEHKQDFATLFRKA